MLLSTITVTGTGDTIADDGAVTLREAIIAANSHSNTLNPGGVPDVISFDIPGAGVHTLTRAENLPSITDAVTIDGTTQPGARANTLAVGNDAVMLIEMDGRNGSQGVAYFTISSGGSGSTLRGLVINRATTSVVLDSGGNVVEGCFINTNPAGSEAVLMPNGALGGGVLIFQGDGNRIGGTAPAARNVIVGNPECVRVGLGNGGVEPSNTLVQGNYIGTNAQGTSSLNRAGYLGISVVHATSTVIGGLTATPGTGAGNVISGNGPSTEGDGIRVEVFAVTGLNAVTIQGNLIGTNATGTAAIPNPRYGIAVGGARARVLIGGPERGAGNVISGNGTRDFADAGIAVFAEASLVTIQNNFIGNGIDGSTPIGNIGDGIRTESSATSSSTTINSIGGTTAGEANVIANNARDGVEVAANLNTFTGMATILGNSIYNNGGLGINLGLGVSGPAQTPNDPGDTDGGVNGLQNFPVIASASSAAGSVTIAGSLNSTPDSNNFRLEFFASASADPSGFGEGQTFLGFTSVNTDSGGNATFSVTLPVAVGAGQFISATATDSTGKTSEFSGGVTVAGTGTADLAVAITDDHDPVAVGQNITYTITLDTGIGSDITNVVLTTGVPANTTFVSFTGPAGYTLTKPAVGGTGAITATGAAETADNQRVFSLVVQVGAGAAGLQIDASATVMSDAAEANTGNNSATATTTVSAVSPTNTAPLAMNDVYAATAGVALTIAARGVLGNDTDPEDDALTAVLASPPAHGTLVLNADGSFVYTAAAGFSGTDTFTYRASDGLLTSGIAAVTVEVAATTTGDAPGPRVMTLKRLGFHSQPTFLVVTFSAPLDAISASNVSNYRITAPGRDGRFGTRDDRIIRLKAAALDPSGQVMVISPAVRLPLYRVFRLAINGPGSHSVTDTGGRLLDGDHNGVAGGAFVARIHRGLLAGPASAIRAFAIHDNSARAARS